MRECFSDFDPGEARENFSNPMNCSYRKYEQFEQFIGFEKFPLASPGSKSEKHSLIKRSIR